MTDRWLVVVIIFVVLVMLVVYWNGSPFQSLFGR